MDNRSRYRTLNKAVRTLNKRREYLEERAERYGSATSYDKAEITAIKIATGLIKEQLDQIHNKYLGERNEYDSKQP